MNKVRHLLKLADEYQTQGVLDLCVKCLRDVPKSEDNVVTILFLATDTEMARDDSRLDGVRSECETLVEDMELADITGIGQVIIILVCKMRISITFLPSFLPSFLPFFIYSFVNSLIHS